MVLILILPMDVKLKRQIGWYSEGRHIQKQLKNMRWYLMKIWQIYAKLSMINCAESIYFSYPWSLFTKICHLVGIRTTIVSLRRSHNNLRFMMRIPVPIRWCLLSEYGPRCVPSPHDPYKVLFQVNSPLGIIWPNLKLPEMPVLEMQEHYTKQNIQNSSEWFNLCISLFWLSKKCWNSIEIVWVNMGHNAWCWLFNCVKLMTFTQITFCDPVILKAFIALHLMDVMPISLKLRADSGGGSKWPLLTENS